MTDETQTPQTDENHLIAERRGKLAALRTQGIAFPNDFRVARTSQATCRPTTPMEAWTAEALEATGRRVAIAGRLMAKRVMGKAAFATDAGHEPAASSCSCNRPRWARPTTPSRAGTSATSSRSRVA
jgi:lysyl-tRNA synthetase class II